MVYALRTPGVLLGIVAGFLAAGALRAALAGGGRELRVWRRWVDPFGAVGVVIAGIGWLAAASPRRAVRELVTDLVVHLAVAATALAGFAAEFGGRVSALQLTPILHGGLQGAGIPFGAEVAIGAGLCNLGCALLCLVPLPPLPAGVLAWSRLPRTPGARRVAYHLLEEHWGVALVLVLLLLPLGNGQSPLLALVDAIGDALLRLAP